MASAEDFVLKVKAPSGQHVLSGLGANNTIGDLKKFVNAMTDIKCESMKLYTGFPPKVVIENDNSTLCDCDIRSGDVVIVQIDDNLENQVVPEITESSGLVGNKKVAFIDEGDSLSGENGIMMRHDVPSNNSCLFTSIWYIFKNGGLIKDKSTKGDDLRMIVAETIKSDPVKYNSAFLSRENSEYCSWILNPKNWGGAIELAIFSEYFKVEICAIDIANCTLHKFGQENNFMCRGILVYDGIHYDPLVMQLENSQQTIFEVRDNRPLDMAMEIAREACSSRQFTDVQNFTLICNVCQLCMRGQQEASAHAKVTGHQNFSEL